MLLENDLEEEILEDDFIEEAEEQEEVNDEAFVEAFVSDVLVCVREYIKRFFGTQEMYCGGSIPERFLLTEKNVSMVANTYLPDGVGRAYKIIEQDGRYEGDAIETLVPDDVKLVISIMGKAAKAGVPQEYIPGIILLYLEYCEGMKVAS